MRIDLQTSSTAHYHARKSCHLLTYLMAVMKGSLLMQSESSSICLIAAMVNWMCSHWTRREGGMIKGWMGNRIALPLQKLYIFLYIGMAFGSCFRGLPGGLSLATFQHSSSRSRPLAQNASFCLRYVHLRHFKVAQFTL